MSDVTTAILRILPDQEYINFISLKKMISFNWEFYAYN